MKKISITTKIQNKFQSFLAKHPLLEKISKKIELFGTFVVSFVSLFITYLIGFGLTKFVSLFFGKKFLETSNQQSQWSEAKYENSVNESMY